jgi:hypothetical protein
MVLLLGASVWYLIAHLVVWAARTWGVAAAGSGLTAIALLGLAAALAAAWRDPPTGAQAVAGADVDRAGGAAVMRPLPIPDGVAEAMGGQRVVNRRLYPGRPVVSALIEVSDEDRAAIAEGARLWLHLDGGELPWSITVEALS